MGALFEDMIKFVEGGATKTITYKLGLKYGSETWLLNSTR